MEPDRTRDLDGEQPCQGLGSHHLVTAVGGTARLVGGTVPKLEQVTDVVEERRRHDLVGEAPTAARAAHCRAWSSSAHGLAVPVVAEPLEEVDTASTESSPLTSSPVRPSHAGNMVIPGVRIPRRGPVIPRHRRSPPAFP